MATMHATRTTTPGWAVAMSASVLLLPVAVGFAVSAFLKTTNPDGVDVTHELAYLEPTLVTTFAFMAVWALACIAVGVAVAVGRGATAAAPVWIVLAVQLLLAAVVLVAQLVERGATGG